MSIDTYAKRRSLERKKMKAAHRRTAKSGALGETTPIDRPAIEKRRYLDNKSADLSWDEQVSARTINESGFPNVNSADEGDPVMATLHGFIRAFVDDLLLVNREIPLSHLSQPLYNSAKINYVEIEGHLVHGSLGVLKKSIEESKYMLSLPEDWDGEGSPGYSETTWRRAIDYLLLASNAYWSEQLNLPSIPRIAKGPDGAVELHWKTSKRELLISFPASEDLPASYFGDDYGSTDIAEGSFPSGDVSTWALRWLMR